MRMQKELPAPPKGALAANTAALAALVLLPLYMMNGYVNLITGKFCLLLVLAFAACLAAPFAKGRLNGKGDFGGMALVVLCADYALALAMAEHKQTAFWGLGGRYNGLLMLLGCSALYFVVRQYAGGIPAGWFTAALVLVGCGVTLVSIANFFMLDPLDAYYSFLPSKGELFLGTVGNNNFYGALLCLCVPLAAQKLFEAQNPKAAFGWGAAFAGLCLGLIPAGSDAAWLGAFAGVAFLCCRKTMKSAHAERLLLALAGFALGAFLLGTAARALPTRSELRTVSAVLAQPAAALGLMVFAVLGALVLHSLPRLPLFLVARVVVAVLGAAVLAAFLYANITAAPLGYWENVLRFSDSWGSNRGFVWSRLWQIWRDDLTLPQRLFGLGGDAVYYRLQIDNFADYAKILNGAVFDSAHSEYLQHLVCGGVLGLLAWLAFLAFSLRRGAAFAPGIAAAVLGYAVQAGFSISMPGVLPLVFVLAALCQKEQIPPSCRMEWRCAALAAACAVPFGIFAEILAGKLG